MSVKDKILVVEDEKYTRFILKKLLVKNNFEVRTAVNGLEAIEVIKAFLPKVIIADWTMDGMDGMDGTALCSFLKGNEQYKFIYFILLTGRASLKDRIEGLDTGADDFLVKPIDCQELLARIRSGIRIQNLQMEIKNFAHDKALVEMACTIGHKINNPLSSIIISLKDIDQELKRTSNISLKEDFHIINRSVDKIKNFVEDLTSLQKPDIIDYASEIKMVKLN